MVRVTGLNLNEELLRWLREHPVVSRRCSDDNDPMAYRRKNYRLRDRLNEREILRMIMARKTGIAIHELADRYGINVKSARKLTAGYGVKESQTRKESA